MTMTFLEIIIFNHHHHLDCLQVVRGEERREEVECPVCTEEMIPPKRIFQVFLSFLVCFCFSELFCLVAQIGILLVFLPFVCLLTCLFVICLFVCLFVPIDGIQIFQVPESYLFREHVCLSARLFTMRRMLDLKHV